MKLLAISLAILAVGCSDNCLDRRCTTTVATGIAANGQVVVMPVTTCICVAYKEGK